MLLLLNAAGIAMCRHNNHRSFHRICAEWIPAGIVLVVAAIKSIAVAAAGIRCY